MEKKENPIDVFVDENTSDELGKEDFSKIIDKWLSKKYVHLKTELNQNQIYAVTILISLAKQYNIKPLKQLINNFLTYMLSKGRKSASELVDILKGELSDGDETALKNISKFLD